MAVVKNINNVVVNNAREPSIYKGLRVFSTVLEISTKWPIFDFRYLFRYLFFYSFLMGKKPILWYNKAMLLNYDERRFLWKLKCVQNAE